MNNEFPRVLAHVYINHRAKWLYQNSVTEYNEVQGDGKLGKYGWFNRDRFCVEKSTRWFVDEPGDFTWIKRHKRMLMNNDGCYESGLASSYFQGGDARYLNPMKVCPRCEHVTESDEDGLPKWLCKWDRIRDLEWFDEAWKNASLKWFNPVLCEVCKTMQESTLEDLAEQHYHSVKALNDYTDKDIDLRSYKEPFRAALLYHANTRRKRRIQEYWARKEEAETREAEAQKRKDELEQAAIQFTQRCREYELRKRTRKQPSQFVINFFQMSHTLATIAKHEQNHTTTAH